MVATVLLDLRAGMMLSGIDACVLGTKGSEAPLAMIELAASGEERVAVGIDVHDTLTAKRVLRDVDLSAVSDDTRALALAAAAEELLRASWAELALQDAPPPERDPPPEVERAVSKSIAPAKVGRRDLALGARLAFEHPSGGLTWLGGDALVSVWPAQRWGLELGAGMRQAPAQHSTHGELSARAVGAGVHLLVALFPRDRALGLRGMLGLQLMSVRVSARAADARSP